MAGSLAQLCRSGFMTCSAGLVGTPKAESKTTKENRSSLQL